MLMEPIANWVKQANAKMKPILDEWLKLGTYVTKYTDWVVL